MKYIVLLVCLSFSIISFAQDDLQKIHDQVTGDQILGDLEFLASDALRGRDTGSEGLEAAGAYLAAIFRAYGVKEVDSTYFQEVPFVSITPPDSAHMTVGDISLTYLEDFIVINGKKDKMTGPKVDIGYGTAEDLEGKDLRFKIAVSIAGDGTSDDPRDWMTASVEKRKRVKEAGALALIEIYQSTMIPWKFLKGFLSQPQTNLDRGTETSDLPNIWLGNPDSTLLVSLKDERTPMHLYTDGLARNSFASANVVGMVEGTNPDLADEYIVYSAHYDHVGIGRADAVGDTIYNGARDNAVGTTAVLSLARYFAQNPPERPAIFAFFTAEEKGLLGSQYFTQNLPVDANQVIYNFNIDNGGYNDTSIISVIGLTRTEAEANIQNACNAFGLEAIEDAAKEQGLFDRSDNVNFARLGIPAPTFSLGFRSFDEEIMKYYHQAGDEVSSLDLEYVEKYIKAYILSSIKISSMEKAPFWIEGDKYYESGVELYGF